MKKKASAIVGTVIAGAGLLAIAPLTRTVHAATNQVVNITFWNGHPSGALQTQMHAEVNEFNKTHPNIHVTYSDKYSEVQPITAAMTAGDAPNVIMPHLDEAQQFAKDGYLVNLTPYINGKNGYTQKQLKNDFYASVWNGRAIEPGQQYILPYEENGNMVIFYNADLLKKAGIQSPPKTWSQVEADAKKVSALGSNDKGIAWTPSLIQYFVMVRDFGGKLWANSKETKFALDNQGAIQALTMLRDMVADKSMTITQNYDYQLDFGTGTVGMLIESSAGWTYDYQSAGGKFTMKASPAPAGPSGHAYNYVDGDSLAILKTGTQAQQQAAWTFIKWLASPQTNAAWDKAAYYLPTGPVAEKDLQSFDKANPNYAAAFSNPTNWMTDPAANATQYYAAENAMNSDFLKALNGQETPAQAVKNMNTIGNEYLSGQKRS
ncbi:ABC transporter substrate-binding protein [Alicyclobacillus acidiphilus]|uniref:ABC transporter substrate-binding protein n=1 Tax=Alicyclobacillus acidiphilus TaxID=182455 RepID=UPI0009FA5750|nr:ABC transporter substrate-binding protein [Alicyclobacillus acidiphilus]